MAGGAIYGQERGTDKDLRVAVPRSNRRVVRDSLGTRYARLGTQVDCPARLHQKLTDSLISPSLRTYARCSWTSCLPTVRRLATILPTATDDP